MVFQKVVYCTTKTSTKCKVTEIDKKGHTMKAEGIGNIYKTSIDGPTEVQIPVPKPTDWRIKTFPVENNVHHTKKRKEKKEEKINSLSALATPKNNRRWSWSG